MHCSVSWGIHVLVARWNIVEYSFDHTGRFTVD